MYVRLATCAVAALSLGVLTASTPGDTPDPVFWTMSAPEGDADGHGNVIEMIVVSCTGTEYQGYPARSGTDVADLVCDIIDPDGGTALSAGEICILLKKLGMGDGDSTSKYVNAPALFAHWCDALPDEDNPETDSYGDCLYPDDGEICAHWWKTPWMSNGIGEHVTPASDGWMDAFVAQYLARQNEEGAEIADPTRFHFDSERSSGPNALCDSSRDAFAACQLDDRWGDEYDDGETVPGQGSDMYGLFDDHDWASDPEWDIDGYDVINFSSGSSWAAATNKPWANWYESLCWDMCDAAMEAACYTPIHNSWGTGVLCSNFKTSVRVDEDNEYHDVSWHGGSDWGFVRPWCENADTQAPPLYPPWVNHLEGSEDINIAADRWAATMRLHRANIDALINSLTGGDTPDEITPWLQNVGESIEVRRNPSSIYHTVTKDEMREMLSMLRVRQLNEFLVWGDGSESQWDDFADVIDQVWMWDIDSATVVSGILTSFDESYDDMQYANDGESYDISSVDSSGFDIAYFDLEFDTTWAGAMEDDFLITVEARLGSGSTATSVPMTVSIYDNDYSWDPLGIVGNVTTGDMQAFKVTADSLNGTYINGSDIVNLRVGCLDVNGDQFTLEVDSVAIAEASDTP